MTKKWFVNVEREIACPGFCNDNFASKGLQKGKKKKRGEKLFGTCHTVTVTRQVSLSVFLLFLLPPPHTHHHRHFCDSRGVTLSLLYNFQLTHMHAWPRTDGEGLDSLVMCATSQLTGISITFPTFRYEF